MTTRKQIEDIRSDGGAKSLADAARALGYRSPFGQLHMGTKSGATASDLFAFFDDNPGAVEAVLIWILDEGRTQDGEVLSDENEECEQCGDEADGELEDGVCEACTEENKRQDAVEEADRQPNG